MAILGEDDNAFLVVAYPDVEGRAAIIGYVTSRIGLVRTPVLGFGRCDSVSLLSLAVR
jgi:hypothetical protein